MARSRTMRRLVGCAVILMAAPAADARQHLVQPGEDWQAVARSMGPGDEVILFPGRHRPGSLTDLEGTAERPIVIRGASAQAPATIAAGRHGLELHRCRHVVVQDLIITGATVGGVVIDDGRDEFSVRSAPPASSAPAPASSPDPETDGPHDAQITLQRLSVLRTGPEGDRDAVRLAGVRGVMVRECSIEGWAGAGVEIIGCRDVTVSDCRLRGRRDHDQRSGVHIRAGSERVRVTRCRFDDAAGIAVLVGGSSAPSDFRPVLPPPSAAESPADGAAAPSPPDQTPDGPARPPATGRPRRTSLPGADRNAGRISPALMFEAREIDVDHCLISGGLISVALAHVNHCRIFQNTIINPQESALRLALVQDDGRFSRGGRATWSGNLVVGDFCAKALPAVIDSGANAALTDLGSNLWWCSSKPQPDRLLQALSELPLRGGKDQTCTVDPRLNDQLGPANPEAAMFGVSVAELTTPPPQPE